MLGRIIFCVVIAAAVLAVVLLATVSPLPRPSAGHGNDAPPGLRALTVYIHPAASGTSMQQQQQGGRQEQEASALVFRHRITAGAEITSKTVGAASGFVLSTGEHGSAMSVFDTVHLAFDAAGLSGSLCVEAAGTGSKNAPPGPGREETLRVVGGTGAFAFARGHAVLRAASGHRPAGGAAATALRLELSVASAAGQQLTVNRA